MFDPDAKALLTIDPRPPVFGASDRAHRADLAWAAGFFDGEGSYCITVHKARDRHARHRIQMTASQNQAAPLRKLQAMFGGKVYVVNRRQRVECTWTISSIAAILGATRALRPFLVVKAEQADLVIRYCTGPGVGQPGRRLPKGATAAREAVRSELGRMRLDPVPTSRSMRSHRCATSGSA